jgi:hypothetical protein
MRGGPQRRNKATIGLVAISVAAVSGSSIRPLIETPALAWLLAVSVGCVVFLTVFVLGLSIFSGPAVTQGRRRG